MSQQVTMSEWLNGNYRHQPRGEKQSDKNREEVARVRFQRWLEGCSWSRDFEGNFADALRGAIRLSKTVAYHPVDWCLRIAGEDVAYVEYKRRFRDSQELQRGEFWVDLYKLVSLEMLARITGKEWWLLVEYNDGFWLHMSERSRQYPTRWMTERGTDEGLPMGAISGLEFLEVGGEHGGEADFRLVRRAWRILNVALDATVRFSFPRS